ncbi:MAG: YceI family protein, partial [Gammaproteobacteria bacterium]
GFSVQRGRFNETAGTVMLDPKAGTGSVQIRINTASISTGLADLEKHLRSPDFFDAERYPEITFTSDRLTFKDEVLTAVDGNLSLHGVTRPLHLDVDHFHCGINMISMKYVCGANATAMIKRSDFNVDKYAPALANDVKIEIQIEAVRN